MAKKGCYVSNKLLNQLCHFRINLHEGTCLSSMSIVSHDVLHQSLGLGTLRTLGVNGQSVNHAHPSCNLEVYHHVNSVKESVLCRNCTL